MTYAAFHAIFLLPPILVLAWLQRGRLHRVHPRAGLFLALLSAVALVYTTPWDNYLVWRGVWRYGSERVLGTIGYVPVEEYLFFLLQPLLVGLWLYRFLPVAPAGVGRAGRWSGAVVYAAAFVAGTLLLRRPEGTYLGLILAWSAPVLALQWAYAGGAIWARRGAWAVGVCVPTLYLCAADAVALHLGIWRISGTYTLGPALGPLPLEEAVFFLVTDLLVVQGLLLFLHPPHGTRTAR
jgi:lycopene cyclase domain-containing protein